MITRPLDLASRLQPPPRPLAGLGLHLLNLCLLAGFFVFFGSRFVLSPGLPVGFALPVAPGAYAGATATAMVLTVKDADFIITEDGLMTLAQLPGWLERQAQARPGARLLVRADDSVTLQDWTTVVEMVVAAGLSPELQIAAEPAAAGSVVRP